MQIKVIQPNGNKIALVESDAVCIDSEQSALDLAVSIQYDCDSHNIIVGKHNLSDDFFDLSTRLAGAVLQKFINYHIKLAVVGDFSNVESAALRDFIFECNRGRDFFFVATEDEAIERLAK